ncbi:MAG TPA: tetratricopeptide repeat protein [Candidatus Melainabacteria bacterium]|nr:tetratricopeptide repeat protein [Candidatus Melainabacteria bacterium]
MEFSQKKIILIACVAGGLILTAGISLFSHQHDIVWLKACEEGLKEREHCNFVLAEKKLLDASEAAKHFAENDERRYSSDVALAELYIATGNFSKATEFIERARISADKQNSVQNKLTVLGLRADALSREAKFDEARKVYTEMAESAKNAQQASFQYDALLGLTKLDILFLKREEAEEVIEQIDVLSSKLSEKTEYGIVLSIYTALLAELKGRYKTAFMLYEDANHIVQNIEKPSSALKLLLANNSATYYLQARNTVRAKNLAMRALDNCDKDFDSYFSGHALQALRNLSAVFLEENELRRARQFVDREIDEVGKRLSHEHPYYGLALEHRAVLESREGKVEDSDKDFKSAQDIFEKSFGPKNRFTADTLADIAKLEFEKNNIESAATSCKQAIAIYKVILPYDHPSSLKAMMLLSLIYKRQGRHEMAHALEVEASRGLGASEGK